MAGKRPRASDGATSHTTADRLLKAAKRHLNALDSTVNELQICITGNPPPNQHAPGLPPEVSQLMQLCLDNNCGEPLGRLLLNWDKDKVKEAVSPWSADTFGAVCVVWPAPFTASLLASKSARWIGRACESMTVKEVSRLLPQLQSSKACKVLKHLHFCPDPYLSQRQCARVLRSFPPEVTLQLARKLGEAAVELLQRWPAGEPDSEDEDSEGDESQGYEGSSADDDGGNQEGEEDADDDEEGEEDADDDEDESGDSDYTPSR